MFVRRRPVARAAVIGGGAYIAGKRAAQRSAQQAEQESGQDERISRVERQAASPAPAEAGPAVADQLRQLASLHGQGTLSDAEFTAAKSRLLGT